MSYGDMIYFERILSNNNPSFLLLLDLLFDFCLRYLQESNSNNM